MSNIEELAFKSGERDVSQYKNMPLDTLKTPDEWAFIYRMATRACQYGTKNFMKTPLTILTVALCLSPRPMNAVDGIDPAIVKEAIHAAHTLGMRDAAYTQDNIGLVRLTVEDIEEML